MQAVGISNPQEGRRSSWRCHRHQLHRDPVDPGLLCRRPHRHHRADHLHRTSPPPASPRRGVRVGYTGTARCSSTTSRAGRRGRRGARPALLGHHRPLGHPRVQDGAGHPPQPVPRPQHGRRGANDGTTVEPPDPSAMVRVMLLHVSNDAGSVQGTLFRQCFNTGGLEEDFSKAPKVLLPVTFKLEKPTGRSRSSPSRTPPASSPERAMHRDFDAEVAGARERPTRSSSRSAGSASCACRCARSAQCSTSPPPRDHRGPRRGGGGHRRLPRAGRHRRAPLPPWRARYGRSTPTSPTGWSVGSRRPTPAALRCRPPALRCRRCRMGGTRAPSRASATAA